MSKCIPCSRVDIPTDLKSIIKLYKEKGLERYIYKTKKIGWQIVTKESFSLVHKKLSKNIKTNGYEYYHIDEFTQY